MQHLLTTEEVADFLRIDPVTVRRLVTRGELVAYRIAGEYRFTLADVEQFVQSQRVIVSTLPGPNHPMAKFTERARKVLGLANEEASRYHHGGVGPEHLLLAIMDEGEGIGARTLHQFQVQPERVREEVEALHPAEERPEGSGQIGMTTQGKESIELAVQEAQFLGHHYLGTEHLLLGLLHQEEGLACQILLAAGVTLDQAREMVKQLLKEHTLSSSAQRREKRRD